MKARVPRDCLLTMARDIRRFAEWADRYPSVDDIDRIAHLSDPVVRNLQITQCLFQDLPCATAVDWSERQLVRRSVASKPVQFNLGAHAPRGT